jgi:hypothetical protein
MNELPEPGLTKQQEWKKKMMKLSASLGRVSSYVSDTRQKEALDRESIVMRYIAQDLLSDIKNYIETREIISTIYYNKYKDLLQYEKNADKNWLVSDILMFMKINKNRDIYRSFEYLSQDFIFTKKHINSQFNLFWKKLSINHRNLFIQVRTPKPKKNLS